MEREWGQTRAFLRQEKIAQFYAEVMASLVAQMVKNPPAMQETSI